jgi:hypothetical protein
MKCAQRRFTGVLCDPTERQQMLIRMHEPQDEPSHVSRLTEISR